MTEEIVKAEPSEKVVANRPPDTWGLAQYFAKEFTEIIPKGLRNKPKAVYALMMYADDLGITALQALQSFYVIEGKISSSAEFMRSQVLKAGHILYPKEASATKVVVYGKRKDSEVEYTCEWTIEDAERAGLVGKDNWSNYPRAMLIARATAEVCRTIFPDVTAGMSYTPEELLTGYREPEVIEAEVTETPTPKSISEAHELITTGEIQHEEEPQPERLDQSQLASSAEVGELAKLRNRLRIGREASDSIDRWMEEKGWTFGKYIDGKWTNSYIPLTAMPEIKTRIEGAQPPKEEPKKTTKPRVYKMSDAKRNRAFAILGSLPKDVQETAEQGRKTMFGDKSRKDYTREEGDKWIAYLESFQEGSDDNN
jgi:hypothetical protein